MAIQQLFSGTSGKTDYIITAFEFLNPGDIDITVGTDVKTSPSDYSIEGSVIKFTSVPTVGTNNIKAERSTNISTKTHTYTPGSSITAQTLNDNQDQALFKIEEVAVDAVNAADLAGDHTGIHVSSNGNVWTINHDTIDGDHLKDNILEAKHIKPNAIASSELADNAVDTAAIANDAVNGTKIADDSIDSEHIAADSIDAEHYAPGSVDATALATDAVTQAKIADETIDEARLQISNNPTNGYILTAQSGNTGGLTWATPNPTGSVLETFTLCCTGTSAVVSSGTYQTQNVQAAQDVNTTGGWVTLNGSLMAYTPPAGTKTVVYKFNYFVRPNNTNGHILYHTSLMLDTDEVTAARYSPYVTAAATQMSQHFEWPFIIRSSNNLSIGQMSSWTSAKTIKILVKAYSDGYLSRFHDMGYWDSNPAATMHHPTISITAIS